MKKLLQLLLFWPTILLAEDSTDKINIGVTIPLTGDYASYGEKIRRGVELASTDLEASGISLNIKYEDVCMPAGAVTAINKLIQIDKIQGIVGNFCVIALPAMSPAIQKNEIPTFHSAISSDSILNLGGYIFTTDLKVRTEAKKLAEYAFNSLHAKTAGVMNIETDFGLDYSKYFSDRFKELGGKILYSESQAIGVHDFRSELTILKNKKPDVILAAHLGGQLGTLLNQARLLGIKSQILGSYEAEDPSVRDVAKSNANGLRFFVPETTEKNQKIKDFENKYVEKYNEKSDILHASSYDSTMILGNALSECRGDGKCAKDYLLKMKEYDGASGHFSLLGSEESKRTYIMKEINEGHVRVVN